MTTPGVLIAGRYRLRTRVASGGMGSVWEAEDEVLGRRVAVKLLLAQPGMSPADAETARNRVIREARITARLHHPHAVTLYDVVEHAGQPCLIMQYVPSRSLNAILQERGVLSEDMTARIGAELASALAAAHAAGIVHRDIKPSNVLITEEGSAKLTDFGISHAAGDVSLTSTGMVSGTPAYLAPEVARGAPSGFPADVFSLGATLYASLEGAPPFGTDTNPMAILHRVASGQVILPRRSGSLTPLLLHMLTPMPGNRPTMADVARALAESADGSRRRTEPERPTAVLPPRTVREWPAEPAETRAAPPAESLLGAAHLPDPPGTSSPPAIGGPPPSSRGASGAATAPERRRRTLVLGAILALALIAAITVGIVLLTHRGASSGVAAGAETSVVSGVSARSATPSPSASGAGAKIPVNTAPTTIKSSPSTSRPSTSASTARSTASTSSSTTASSTTASSTTASSTTASSTTASSTSTSTSPSTPGTPTGAELAAAVTAYYAELPAGTDNGWAHLTPNFQTEIAHGRGNYQTFWDGIESVTLSNVRGTAPGTVQATVTYTLKNGQTSVEDARYQLVSSDGILKIDSQQ